MSNKIQFRRDLATNWTTANPILSDGELGFETDTGLFKIGDGIKTWNTLSYNAGNSGSVSSMLLPNIPDPTSTPTNSVRIYGQNISNRTLPTFINSNGTSSAIQPFLGRNNVGYWNPPGNANTVPAVFGFTPYTSVGTATARVVAVTNLFTRTRRLGYVSAATVGALTSNRVAVAQITLGNGTLGGFHKLIRFGISDAVLVPEARTFVGISTTTTAPTNIDLATLKNGIGIGAMETDSNFKIYYGGAVSQPPIDLGPNFPSKTTTVDMYELSLYSPSFEDSKIYWEVTRLNTDHVAKGVIDGSIDPANTLPNNLTLMSYSYMWRTNNTAAVAVGLDIFHDYIETEH